jgi:hypothetical protein
VVEIAGSNDDGMDKKKHWVLPYLSIGNQMSTGAGQLRIDRERFKVKRCSETVANMMNHRKSFEIVCSESGMDKKQAVELPLAPN